MAGIDKVTRILMLYAHLCDGRRIYKKAYCADMEIDRRTFDRDIEDIRLFLSETYSGNELIYDRSDESYYLTHHSKVQMLSDMEMTMILASLNESQVLRQDEYEGIVTTILDSGEKNKQKVLKSIARRNIRNYKPKGRDKAILKMQWDLQQCISECDVIELCMEDESKTKCKPVELHLYENAFYLFAYTEADELIVIPMDDIESFKMVGKKYPSSLHDKFDTLSQDKLKKTIEKGRDNYGN